MFIRVWAVSTATLVCGWTVILAVVIAAHDQSAPPTAALSSLERRTSHWTQWKCGQLENLQNQRRWENFYFLLTFFAFLADNKVHIQHASKVPGYSQTNRSVTRNQFFYSSCNCQTRTVTQTENLVFYIIAVSFRICVFLCVLCFRARRGRARRLSWIWIQRFRR